MRQRLTRLALATLLVGPSLLLADVQPASAVPNTPVWTRDITGSGSAIGESSPTAADLNGDGTLDIVVGSQNGRVYAVNGASGADLGGWPQQTSHHIDSSPSVADTDGNGQLEVFIGSGAPDDRSNVANCGNTNCGAVYSYTATGALRWRGVLADNVFTQGAAVFSTPALGDINRDNVADVNVASLGLQSIWSLNSQNGGANPGWPFYSDDADFSSPALGDVNGDGQTDMVIGSDSTPGPPVDARGGFLRAFSGNGQQLWQFQTDEAIRSSPVIADIDGDGQLEVVVGSGNYWAARGGSSFSTKVLAVNARTGALKWTRDLGATVLAAPAVADINGDGVLDVAIGTWQGGAAGRAFALRGSDGTDLPNWGGGKTANLHANILGQMSTADFNNDGGQDVVVPGSAGIVVYNGKTGAEMFRLAEGFNTSFQNAPLITDIDSDGRLDIVAAGTKDPGGTRTGVIYRFEAAPAENAVLGNNGYPQWRKDVRKTGSFTNPPLTQAAVNLCEGKPAEAGYYMVARDGGIFAFCKTFFGSTGALKLNQPIVGMETTPDGGGYWLVAADGGIFAFGNARFLGSTGGIRLNQPIVGMARTASGLGYYLVASDGGIFAFGDAVFRGSTGAIKLNQPIVGMALAQSGAGYYLVARDGGIFAYGGPDNAPFLGSTGAIKLNQPIVGMEVDRQGGRGYYLVASDGGIFAYDAPFHGSTGAIKLNQPIVGMAQDTDGFGYYMVASDGGIFAFPSSTPFVGSTGNIRLNQPIVGMAVPIST